MAGSPTSGDPEELRWLEIETALGLFASRRAKIDVVKRKGSWSVCPGMSELLKDVIALNPKMTDPAALMTRTKVQVPFLWKLEQSTTVSSSLERADDRGCGYRYLGPVPVSEAPALHPGHS